VRLDLPLAYGVGGNARMSLDVSDGIGREDDGGRLAVGFEYGF